MTTVCRGMLRPYRVIAGLVAGLAASTAAIAVPPVDLAALDRDMAGPRAQVLVLGTVHLAELPAGFDMQRLDPLLDRLEAFAPQIIAVESLSGEECDLYRRHPTVYSPGSFCGDIRQAQVATGLDVPAAIAAVDELLAAWPGNPEPADRRRLAGLFLAAGERGSAYVQWLQLPPAERRAGDGLDEGLVALLSELDGRANEEFRIAAPLAARLGLQRLYATDDHTGDNLRITDVEAFARDIRAAWDAGRNEHAHVHARQDALLHGGDMLALYRYLNGPESMAAAAGVNVEAALRAPSEGHHPQAWVAGWEIRNLRMVANVRETFRERPGARVLAMVGVSHKPWFDTWLGQLQGVDVVDVQPLLGDD